MKKYIFLFSLAIEFTALAQSKNLQIGKFSEPGILTAINDMDIESINPFEGQVYQLEDPVYRSADPFYRVVFDAPIPLAEKLAILESRFNTTRLKYQQE